MGVRFYCRRATHELMFWLVGIIGRRTHKESKSKPRDQLVIGSDTAGQNDIHQDTGNTRTIISEVHCEISNNETTVPDIPLNVTNTQPIVSEVESDAADTYTIFSDTCSIFSDTRTITSYTTVSDTRAIVSDPHGDRLNNREDAGSKNQAVSITRTP